MSDLGSVHAIHLRVAGGVPKLPVSQGFVGHLGLEGDGQADPDHGGPTRALCLFSLERINALRVEGHPITPGATGENLTLTGVPWERVEVGTRLRIGAVEVEVTEYTTPCRTIIDAFRDGRYDRISQRRHPGWSRVYARVITTGKIHENDPVEFIGTPASS